MQHEGHRQRLKERFMAEGFDSFQPHEVLEFVLYFCIPQGDTNELAHRLIEKFGSLSRVFEARVEDLVQVKGIKMHSATLLSIMPAVFRAYSKDRWGDCPVLNTPETAGKYVRSLFEGRTYEVLVLISLNKAKKVLNWKVINEGTLDSTSIHPRTIIEEVIAQKAQQVILAHNHPSGSINPSFEDKVATKNVQVALETIDVKLLDHFIIAGCQTVSMANLGLV